MRFTVVLPDTADIDGIAAAVQEAGGTVEPAADTGAGAPAGPPPGPGGEQVMPGMAPEMPLPGMAPEGMPPMGDMLAAGPGAGMAPGAAMAQRGARALRPRV